MNEDLVISIVCEENIQIAMQLGDSHAVSIIEGLQKELIERFASQEKSE